MINQATIAGFVCTRCGKTFADTFQAESHERICQKTRDDLVGEIGNWYQSYKGLKKTEGKQ